LAGVGLMNDGDLGVGVGNASHAEIEDLGLTETVKPGTIFYEN
jgi:hypothetical protein